MGFRHISCDVKIASLNLYEHGHLTLPKILDCVGFSERKFYRILNLWRTTDDVVTYKKSHGRSRILHHDDVQYLLRLLKRSPDWFLDKLLELLKTNWFLSVHFTTIHRALERAGLSTKDLKFVADERSEPVRNEFIRQAAQYPPEYLGFLNETSKNDRTAHRRRGRAPKAKRAVKRQEFVRGPRVTAVGLTTARIMTSKVVEGSMKRATYLEFLEYQVVCLHLFP
ncbi:hypothetical protein C8F04DRAFT_1047940 [Mycena alexandri]|uniref:Transposase n=1 Tax=Mycena alexandri TaxID=1745969 RepID=A0AAD6WSB7_9AGAR|nr:hypothetical protein C8F04DRAFT_1047940 [Mycena alexandri]